MGGGFSWLGVDDFLGLGDKNAGPFLGITKEAKTPLWHLLDPRVDANPR